MDISEKIGASIIGLLFISLIGGAIYSATLKAKLDCESKASAIDRKDKFRYSWYTGCYIEIKDGVWFQIP